MDFALRAIGYGGLALLSLFLLMVLSYIVSYTRTLGYLHAKRNFHNDEKERLSVEAETLRLKNHADSKRLQNYYPDPN